MADEPIPSFDQTEPIAQAQPQGQAPASAPSFDDTLPVFDEKYNTPGQGILGTAEGFSKGLLGHTVTAGAESLLTKAGVPGLAPEDQQGREEATRAASPYLPAAEEALGFGAGMFTGVSEAKALGAIGQGAVKLAKLGESANFSAKLAAGATRTAAELAAMQADDEVSRVINGTTKGVGDAITNIGLAGVLGGVTGGAATGLGIGVKGALDAVGLKEFADRMAYRGANAHPNETMEKEFNDTITQYHAMNDELTGPQGLKAQALEKIMPKMSGEIAGQVQEVTDKSQKAAQDMMKRGVPERYVQKFLGHFNDLQEAITNPEIATGQVFDALNTFKQELQGYSKGNFGPFAVPKYHEAYDFLNITKSLGHDVRTALEDPSVWGKVADLQKQINKSWTQVLPAVKDAQSKFMEKIGGEYLPSTTKFGTYISQNGKSVGLNTRQKMMGNFIDSMEDHFNAVDSAYKAAGVPNPFPPPGMGALKESISKQSIGSKLADLWYDKMSAQALGNAAGMAAGQVVSPGIGGIYAGKWVLGPMFGSVLKPILEKASNMEAFQGAMKFVKSAADGNSKLINATGELFKAGSKTLPNHLIPDAKQLLKLDDKLKEAQNDPTKIMNVAGNLDHYLPDNAQHLAATASSAVTTLNAMRPNNPKTGILDAEIPPSKAQEAEFQRKLLVAEQPLMVLEHIKDGTVLPQDVSTLRSLYPEFYVKMAQQITTAMNDHIHSGGAIPYKTRQGLSLFLGTPLDSTMTPQAIASIQATFAPQQPQPQPSGGKQKGSTAKLGKIASNMETQGQGRELRANKS